MDQVDNATLVAFVDGEFDPSGWRGSGVPGGGSGLRARAEALQRVDTLSTQRSLRSWRRRFRHCT